MDAIVEMTKSRDPEQYEFHQAVTRWWNRSNRSWTEIPNIASRRYLERITEPERVVMFRVPWVDDNGQVQVNRGFRIEMSSAPSAPTRGGCGFIPRSTFLS
jgi:glutamate dehydrogenase (NADP+)